MYASDVPMYDIPCVRLPGVRVRAWVSISTRFNIRTWMRARVSVIAVACTNVDYNQLPKSIS